MRFFRLLPLLAVVLAACPKRGTTRAAGGPTVTIFVTGSLDAAALPVQAAVVRKARAQGPSLWLAVGDAQVDERWRELTDGEAVVRLLDAAGVDALLMGPEWLRFGPERCRELVDMARCHLLCANVSDTLRSVIGREFMVRRFEQVVVAVSAVWLDSTALEFRQAGVGFVAPEYAGARVGQVLRQRAGLTSLLAGPGLVQVRPEYDLTVAVDGDTAGGLLTPLAGPGRMARYRVTLLDGAVSDVVREDVPLDGVEPDPMVASVLGSLAGAVDSLAAVVVVESKVVVPPYSLGRVVARGLAAQSAADHVVYDTLAWDSILPGVITQG
ncbi:hypothetical protein FJY71_08885, partial [candidate division WOR-3 bacterium]|nr:hypothetical protein [candidate division WOR-3 bacterium]